MIPAWGHVIRLERLKLTRAPALDVSEGDARVNRRGAGESCRVDNFHNAEAFHAAKLTTEEGLRRGVLVHIDERTRIGVVAEIEALLRRDPQSVVSVPEGWDAVLVHRRAKLAEVRSLELGR